MGRPERRKLENALKKTGKSQEQINQVLRIHGLLDNEDYTELYEGQKVTVKVDQIKQRDKLSKKYLDWIESLRDKIVTVEYDHADEKSHHMVCIKESPIRFLIWEGDVSKVEEG